MEVTSYLLAEMATTVLDDKETWASQIEALGLEGQKAFLQDGATNPIPFLRVTDRIKKTFDILCPATCKLKDFKAEPIPPAVLEVIGLVIKENYFDLDEISVHYRPGYPDPVLMATKKIEGNTETFLLAQWGAEKMTLDRAEHEARKVAKATFVARLQIAKGEAEAALLNPDAYIEKAFSGQWVYPAGVSI